MYKKHLICFVFSLHSFQAGFVDCKNYSHSKVYPDVFMTISLRFLLCLCAALCLCCGVASAQQPTQQRFLRFLGQRSVTTGTLLQTLEPIRCGLPAASPLVFAMTDAAGQIIRDDSSIVTLSLVEQFIPIVSDTNIADKIYILADKCVSEYRIGSCFSEGIRCQQGPIPQRLSAGIIEFNGITIYGTIKPSLTLLCSSANVNVRATTANVSLIGGAPIGAFFAKTKSGKLAVPGISTGDVLGFTPFAEVGTKLTLHNPDSTDFNYVTIKITDIWLNPTSFSTTVTLNLYAVDDYRNNYVREVVAKGHIVKSDPATGLAIFRDLEIYRTTSNSIGLSPNFSPSPYSYPIPRTTQGTISTLLPDKNESRLNCSIGWTTATFSLVPGPAVGIAPLPLKPTGRIFPRSFEIGKSNASDTSRWFYLQAVDKCGNRVDKGPNAYNGGVATIRITPPEEGLPRSTTSNFQFSASADPYVRTNSQRFAATGTSAVAVNGLYTFNNFTPLGPASSSTTDTVVLTFEDPAFRGGQISDFSQFGYAWLAMESFRPIPPITTATTTFVRTTNVALRGEISDFSLTPNPTSDALHITLTLPESSPVLVRMEDMLGHTMLRYEEQSALQGAFATTLDVSRLAQGAYTLHVQSGRGRWTRRVVILR